MAQSSRSTQSFHRTRVSINCYDLLPPGRISSCLWYIGYPMLHSGVVIDGKEYAYGGHDKPGISGVYYSRPGAEPPGGRFRCEILQGFTFRTHDEIQTIIREASHRFLGPQWHLLNRNCNHFTNDLCQDLTGREAPAWLNRAANIGVMVPCLVPRAFVAAPDAETAEGDLVEGDEYDDADEDEADAHIDEQARLLTNERA